MADKSGRGRFTAKDPNAEQIPHWNARHKLTYPDGRKETVPDKRYRELMAAGQIPKGTHVEHSTGGWCIIGATVADVFGDD